MVPLTLEEIRNHWERAGRAFPPGGAVTPTSRDPFLGRMEEENILAHLRGRERVLEVGCGDGAHTAKYAEAVGSLTAVDVAASLVDRARERLAGAGLANAEVLVGSVTDLGGVLGGRTFDCVVSQRCLINLPEWEYQKAAIREIVALLEPGGLFLMTEGFQDGLDELNLARAEVGLDEIRVVPYNRNFRRAAFEEFAAELFDVVEVRNYGTYLLLSRLHHPLAVRPEPPRHDSPINEAAARFAGVVDFPDAERYSYNLFYALRRRAPG